MMESTAPKEYEAIATGLPKISEEKQAMVEQIVAIQVGWREEFAVKISAPVRTGKNHPHIGRYTV